MFLKLWTKFYYIGPRQDKYYFASNFMLLKKIMKKKLAKIILKLKKKNFANFTKYNNNNFI